MALHKQFFNGSLFLFLPLLLAGCVSAPPKAPYPHESVLTVVAELKIYLDQDPYRTAPGQDLTGRNIFRVSLERLAALEAMADPQYADVLAFAKGQCLERLGQWPQARAAFGVAAERATSLAPAAKQRAANAGRMDDLLSHARSSTTLEGYLNDLEVLDRRLQGWLDERPAWPCDAFIRQARERLLAERVWFLFTNRLVSDKAAARAIEAAQRLVQEHKDSYQVMEHWLLLGSLYEGIARDWTARRQAAGLDFRLEDGWTGWIEQGRQAYRRVAQADGDPAKLEGQARLRALDAYALRIQGLAR